MSRILSLDPGLTTGIAISTEDGVEVTMTVGKTKLLANGFFNHLVLMAKPDFVLVETVPDRSPDLTQFALVQHVYNWFKTAGYVTHLIRPVEWKNFVERVEINGSHARDAATMARWWIENARRKHNQL